MIYTGGTGVPEAKAISSTTLSRMRSAKSRVLAGNFSTAECQCDRFASAAEHRHLVEAADGDYQEDRPGCDEEELGVPPLKR